MEKTALVLGGGGALGAYQAEVARRISPSLDLCAITGVSVGALNGSILSQGSTDKLKDIWKETRKSDVWSGGHTFWRYVNLILGNKLGLYSSDPLQEKVEKYFNPNEVKVPFQAGSVNLETGEYVRYQISPDLNYTDKAIDRARRFVCASAAIPGAVEPIKVDEDKEMMVDGGIRNMAPISDSLDFDPDRIVVILNTSIQDDFLSNNKAPSHIFEVGASALEVLFNETTINDVRTARKINDAAKEAGGQIGDYKYVDIDVIGPSGPIGSAQDFSRAAYKNRVKIGKRDAKNFLDRKT